MRERVSVVLATVLSLSLVAPVAAQSNTAEAAGYWLDQGLGTILPRGQPPDPRDGTTPQLPCWRKIVFRGIDPKDKKVVGLERELNGLNVFQKLDCAYYLRIHTGLSAFSLERCYIRPVPGDICFLKAVDHSKPCPTLMPELIAKAIVTTPPKGENVYRVTATSTCA